MLCPASMVKECGEFASHTESMYLHLRDEHTPDELARALLSYHLSEIEIRIGNDIQVDAATKCLAQITEYMTPRLRNPPWVEKED